MKVIVDMMNGTQVEREFTPELIEEMERIAEKWSGNYSHYVPSMTTQDGRIHLYFDGPWEC